MSLQQIINSVFRKYISVMLLLFVGLFTFAQESTVMVISNVKGAPPTMKITELKSVMKGERQRWSDGTKVSIYLMKTATTLGKSTCDKIYKMSTDQVKRFWLERSFAGKADIPTFCNTVAELESLVSQNPGAIGIVDKSSGTAGTKAIIIDGKASF